MDGVTPRRNALPEGIFSLLDTDLYKLTMQCAILKYLPDIRECFAKATWQPTAYLLQTSPMPLLTEPST